MFTKFGEAKVRASEFRQCFYCCASLPATKKEHIFNSCWGGSHCTTKLICNRCNEFFSQSIDSALSVYTTLVMNAWAFKGERHKQIPNIETAGEFICGKYAKPKWKKPKITKEALPDGFSSVIKLYFNSKEEAYKFLKSDDLEAHFGGSLTAEEQKQIRQSIAEAKIEEVFIDELQELSFEINLQEQYRSAAHTLLKCLSMYVPEFVRGDEIKSIRKFARYGKGHWEDFAVEVRSIIPSAVSFINGNPHFNIAEIYWCRVSRKVVGVLTLLGRIRRAVVLAEDYQGDTSAILYISEDTYCSKKPPKAGFAELDSNVPLFPLIEVSALSFSSELYNREIQDLISRSWSVEAPTASLLDGIARLEEEIPEINTIFLQRYEELFIKFASLLERAFRVSLNKESIPSKLATYGLTDLARNHIGNSCNNEQVQFILTKISQEMYKELIQLVSNNTNI